MLILDTAIIPPDTGASSCLTINNAWARHGNAGPNQRHLIVSLGQSYSQTRGPDTLECLCYMKECLLQIRVSSCQTRTIMWPSTGECLCQTIKCSSHTRKLPRNANKSVSVTAWNACHKQSNHSTRQRHPVATQQGVLVPDQGMLNRCKCIYLRPWDNHIPGHGYTGMHVLHEGMLAADKDVLLSNADNHVARHMRMLVSDNGVLISYKEVFLSCKRDHLSQARGCSSSTKQSFHQTRASSCHTIYSAWARQRNAGPEQEHLVDSLGQS